MSSRAVASSSMTRTQSALGEWRPPEPGELLVFESALPGRRTVNLSITHNFRPDHGAQPDIGEARQAAPYDNVSRRRIIGACEIAVQSGDLGQIVRKGFPPQGNSALILDELVEQLDFGLGQGGTW